MRTRSSPWRFRCSSTRASARATTAAGGMAAPAQPTLGLRRERRARMSAPQREQRPALGLGVPPAPGQVGLGHQGFGPHVAAPEWGRAAGPAAPGPRRRQASHPPCGAPARARSGRRHRRARWGGPAGRAAAPRCRCRAPPGPAPPRGRSGRRWRGARCRAAPSAAPPREWARAEDGQRAEVAHRGGGSSAWRAAPPSSRTARHRTRSWPGPARRRRPGPAPRAPGGPPAPGGGSAGTTGKAGLSTSATSAGTRASSVGGAPALGGSGRSGVATSRRGDEGEEHGQHGEARCGSVELGAPGAQQAVRGGYTPVSDRPMDIRTQTSLLACIVATALGLSMVLRTDRARVLTVYSVFAFTVGDLLPGGLPPEHLPLRWSGGLAGADRGGSALAGRRAGALRRPGLLPGVPRRAGPGPADQPAGGHLLGAARAGSGAHPPRHLALGPGGCHRLGGGSAPPLGLAAHPAGAPERLADRARPADLPGHRRRRLAPLLGARRASAPGRPLPHPRARWSPRCTCSSSPRRCCACG